MDYLTNFEMKPSNFYGLPKVHKNDKIRDACEQTNNYYVEGLRMLYVSGHIEDCARNQLVKFRILPLYKMQTDSASARKLKENDFIGVF